MRPIMRKPVTTTLLNPVRHIMTKYTPLLFLNLVLLVATSATVATETDTPFSS